MASSPILTVLEESKVSPPPGTGGDRLLPHTYLDLLWLRTHPIHNLFFYELSTTQPQFIQTIVPNLKHSLSITLQHFFPFAGKLFLYPTCTKNPEIRYVEGDSVTVTFAECNLDFNQLTKNHPRDCELFYHLTPKLGQPNKTSDSIIIPLFSVQVTLFPNSGISIGVTNHHSLGDARTRFYFLKAWTSIARFGTDESFLANGTLPVYDRIVNSPKLYESYLKYAKVDTFMEDYEPPKLGGTTNKVRGTFILPRTTLGRLKQQVLTQQPTLAYVSSFTVACAYIWSCMATARNDDLQLFSMPIDCRARLNPPVPAAYFGNCVGGCLVMEKTMLLKGKEGFVNAAKLIGESLHDILTDKNGVLKERLHDIFTKGIPTTRVGVSGTPKLKFYDLDFGWGKATKLESVSIEYDGGISMNACKENSEDFEIGVCLSTTEMENFVRAFDDGLESHI